MKKFKVSAVSDPMTEDGACIPNHNDKKEFPKSAMKQKEIIKMAGRNLVHNFSRSALALFTIILLSISIIFIGNFCYTLKQTLNRTMLDEVNSFDKVSISITASSVEPFEKKFLENFMKEINKIGINEDYICTADAISVYCGTSTKNFEIRGFLTEIEPTYPITFVEGKGWDANDFDNNGIWISETEADSRDLKIGDSVDLNYTYYGSDGNKSMGNFIIKGIVKADVSFISCLYLPKAKIDFNLNSPNFKNIKIMQQTEKLEQQFVETFSADNGNYFSTEAPVFNSTILYSYSSVMPLYYFVFGVCAFIIVMCVLLCIGCVVNTLKISIENNASAIGIMRSIGMRNNSIKQYIFCQIVCLIMLGTAVGMLVSYLLGFGVYPLLCGLIVKMIFGPADIVAVNSFNWLMPLLSTAILLFMTYFGTVAMTKRYFKTSTVFVLQGGAE